MTRWNTAKVGQWARDAGWTGAELHHAVAVAMAASQGDDHHVSNPSYVPALERRGLWALRASEAPDLDADDLFNPVKNAAAAHAAWSDHGRSWSWHPVWVAGAADEHVGLVRAVLTGKLREPSDPATRNFLGMLDGQARLLQAMEQQRRHLSR